MTKIKSFPDLKRHRDNILSRFELSEKETGHESHVHVKIAMATCGLAAGAKQIMDFFTEQLDRRNIDGEVTQTGCMGYCYAEPTVEVLVPGKEPIVFGYVDVKRADEIIEKYIKGGTLVEGIIPMNYKKIDD
jgi:NADP-reducing hydrogenase subunit HndB